MKTILTIIGTRPEAVKLAPILKVMSQNNYFNSKVCVTKQHIALLDPFLINYGIVSDYQFPDNPNNASLSQNAAFILEHLSLVLAKAKPDLVIVQGDTTTAFAAALASFYLQIPLAHIEAGLRTDNLNSPWPEEAHRWFIDRVSSYYFAPTKRAKETLIAEGVSSGKIWVVGNTSIDAIRVISKFVKPAAKFNQRTIVVTVHRRENHGERLQEICQALKTIANQFVNVRIVFVLHPNPTVNNPVMETLSGIPNVDLIEPIDHLAFVQLVTESDFIITDSGGIQEEAPFMGKPVVVIRDTTERPEGVNAGTARLVGTKSEDIIECCKELLECNETLTAMSKVHFPYGDGFAAERIVKILEQQLKEAA